jgi:hypothetical protein
MCDYIPVRLGRGRVPYRKRWGIVNHLKQISGIPETLKPDAQILKEAYSGRVAR